MVLSNLALVAISLLPFAQIGVSSSTGAATNVQQLSRRGCSPNCFFTSGNPNCINLGGGSFQALGGGTSTGNQVCGKGWSIGSPAQVIQYTGTYLPTGNSYFSVYGWTRSPLVEYYIVESYGSYNPSSAAARKGTVNCDGASYDILSTTRVNQPSIDGTQTFQQFWSVRNPKKTPGAAVSGTVTTACHFTAWKQYGLNLGTNFNYQILAVETYFSSVNATFTIL